MIQGHNNPPPAPPLQPLSHVEHVLGHMSTPQWLDWMPSSKLGHQYLDGRGEHLLLDGVALLLVDHGHALGFVVVRDQQDLGLIEFALPCRAACRCFLALEVAGHDGVLDLQDVPILVRVRVRPWIRAQG